MLFRPESRESRMQSLLRGWPQPKTKPAQRLPSPTIWDETGVLLSVLNSLKVLVGRNELKAYKGAGVKRSLICRNSRLYFLYPNLSDGRLQGGGRVESDASSLHYTHSKTLVFSILPKWVSPFTTHIISPTLAFIT